MRRNSAIALNITLLSCTLILPIDSRADNDNVDPAATLATKTPIKHIVVIFDENNSFDHYFGTYPSAVPNLNGTTYLASARTIRRRSMDIPRRCSPTIRIC